MKQRFVGLGHLFWCLSAACRCSFTEGLSQPPDFRARFSELQKLTVARDANAVTKDFPLGSLLFIWVSNASYTTENYIGNKKPITCVALVARLFRFENSPVLYFL